MKKVSAVVVIYNGMRRNWIQKCFDSLLNSSIPINIIAIDNGSTDGSIEYIHQHYPQIDFTVSKENLGFGKANNMGMKRVLDKNADHVFLLNQDAWVDVNTVEQLVKQQAKYPEYGVLSPIHCNGEGTALDYRFSEYISPQKGCNILSDLLVINRQMSKIYAVNFVNAAAWLINKECVKKVGGFSPMFYHYGEDINYCHRLQFHGLKIGVHPGVRIYHDRAEVTSNKYFSPDQVKKRALFVKMLNPNAPLSYRQAVKTMNREIVKNLFNLDFKTYRKFLIGKNEISAMKHTIDKHLMEVSSRKPFMYIND